MKTTRLFTLFLFAACLLRVSAQPLVPTGQPLIRQASDPINQNIRAAAVFDFDADVVGDDYNGFTVGYASAIYPIDQMVISYTHLNPEQSTMMQVQLSLEEYWPITDIIMPYGTAGAGYLWTDYDEQFIGGDTAGWFGSLGVGLLFRLVGGFDLYGEFVYQVSQDDLWIDGMDTSKSNNTSLVLGFRYTTTKRIIHRFYQRPVLSDRAFFVGCGTGVPPYTAPWHFPTPV